MRNYKYEHNLTGSQLWPEVSTILVEGFSDAAKLHIEEGKTAEDYEEVIRTWNNVVVLRATAPVPTPFYIGFYDMGTMQYLTHELVTDLEYAMRVGPYDMCFFAIPKDLSKKVKLELVEQTTEDDPKYKDTILI